jgi:hypothetical protein
MSCQHDRFPDDARPGMLRVATGSCGLISLGTTSRDLGMFGPLERAWRATSEAAWAVVASPSAPSTASMIFRVVVIVRPSCPGRGSRPPDVMASMGASSPRDFALDQGLDRTRE